MSLKWGIAITGQICHDFASALQSESKEHQIVAVASTNIDDAKKLADLHEIKKAYDSYEQLAKEKEVDVIYIGTINSEHLPVAKLMLENGKHLLSERLTLNSEQVNELLSLSKKNNLFFMEAIWSRFLPSHQATLKEIKEGLLGHIKHVDAEFGVVVDKTKKSLGVMLDIGFYCLSLILFIFKGEKPEKVVSVGYLNNEGVDESIVASFLFKNGKTAQMSINSLVEYPNKAFIIGEKKIYVVYIKPENHEGLNYQAKEARKCIRENKIQSEIMPHDHSLLLASICDQIRGQIGVRYDQE